MSRKRKILEELNRNELLSIVGKYDVQVEDKRVV